MMFRLVRERCESQKFSSVVVTHDLNLAAAFADEILLLKSGEVLAKGKPKEVLSAGNLREVFNVEILLDENPATKKLRVTTIY